MKKLALLLLCSALIQEVHAQSDSIRSKKVVHLVGVQANALFRQIFNFGNANNPVNNPYLLTYDVLSSKKKIGANLGLGYTRNNTFVNDGNTNSNNFINDLYLRVGVSKMIPLNKRFVATVYLHAVYNNLDSKTVSEENFNGQFTRITTTTTATSYGGGPALSLRYKVANRVWLGTEANYYFRTGNTKSSAITYTEFQGIPGTTESQKSDNDFSNFTLSTPTAIFLILRF